MLGLETYFGQCFTSLFYVAVQAEFLSVPTKRGYAAKSCFKLLLPCCLLECCVNRHIEAWFHHDICFLLCYARDNSCSAPSSSFGNHDTSFLGKCLFHMHTCYFYMPDWSLSCVQEKMLPIFSKATLVLAYCL
jgi:hypothetical protein